MVATTGSGSSRPCQGLLRDNEAESSRLTTRRRPDRPEPHWPAHRRPTDDPDQQAGNVCWHDRHPFGQLGPVQQAGVDHGLHHHSERGLQAEHPERRLSERVLLVVPRMWRVVGRHRVDGPVRQCLPYGLDVLVGPQRRVDLVGRVVAEHLSGSQHEVMRRNLRRDIDATLFGPPDHVDRLGAGHMANVQPGSGEFGDLYISSNHARLGRCRPSRESEFPGDLTSWQQAEPPASCGS